jgi:hypothetical protein
LTTITNTGRIPDGVQKNLHGLQNIVAFVPRQMIGYFIKKSFQA